MVTKSSVTPLSAFAARKAHSNLLQEGSIVSASAQESYSAISLCPLSKGIAPKETINREPRKRPASINSPHRKPAKRLRHLGATDLQSQLSLKAGNKAIAHKIETATSIESNYLELDVLKADSGVEAIASSSDTGIFSDSPSESSTSHSEHQVQLSSFLPTKGNVLNNDAGGWTLRLIDGDWVALLGQYDIWVRKGAISILGAILHASSKTYRVYAPSTHSLPLVRHLRNPYGPLEQPAEVSILSCSAKIRLLRQLSKKFERIWNCADLRLQASSGPQFPSQMSFSFLGSSSDDPRRRPLTTIKPLSDWLSLLATLGASSDSDIPRGIMVCGPKNSGKSTFTRLLINTTLTRSPSPSGVFLLDLDPGKPEYSPPGDISLLYIGSCNLGPPFTHPMIPKHSTDKLIKTHHIGALTPRDDLHHYMQCIYDLFGQYQCVLPNNASSPIIINCPGWILGSGLDILEDLIRNLPLTNVVYMSTVGPEDVVGALKKVTSQKTSLHTLCSQPYEYMARNAADLRMMQTLSYFHLDESEAGKLRWDASPIHTIEPLTLYYAGPKQDIVGIMVLGEEIVLDFLSDLIDGSILGIIALEDDSCIPQGALITDINSSGPEGGTVNDKLGKNISRGIRSKTSDDLDRENKATQTDGISASISPDPTNFDIPPKSTAKPSSKGDSSIIRRTKEKLPYFFIGSGTCIPLNPSKTRSIGQVLMRGIDTSACALQVITPIPRATIERYQAEGIKLMLVQGRLDTPSWAYQEECTDAIASQKHRQKWRKWRKHGSRDAESADSAENVAYSDEEFDVEAWTSRTPWVSIAKRTKHRRDRVWKVRRNLQTNDVDGFGGMSG